MAHKHTVLVLPFTTSILNNPEDILPFVYSVTTKSVESCTVLFSTPSQSGGDLYQTIRQLPKKYWDTFQRFLGKLYGTMGAAQWIVGRVLMDVEVLFEGMELGLEQRLGGRKGVEVFVLDSLESLPIMSKLKEIIGDFKPKLVPTPTPLDTLSVDEDSQDGTESSAGGYHTTALGGTFDHLHAAHKLLLHLSLFLTTNKLIVGLMTPSLLVSKSNNQLLEPLDERIRKVHDFLKGINIKGVELDVCEIHDPYGPTAWDGDIQALVVSRETMSGGEAVNKKRREAGLGELDIWVIDVIAAEPELATPAGGAEGVSLGDENRGNHSSIKTRDLTLETDEGKLKALKMGSTAIRQWIKDHPGKA